jgi:FkbM family methyltransferase
MGMARVSSGTAFRALRRLFQLVRFVGPASSIAFLTQWVSGKSVMSLATPGLSRPVLVRRQSRDVWVYRQVFLDRECDIPMPPPRLIVDAGANVGYTTLYFAARFPAARIIAVEPEAENCQFWRRNCEHLARAELLEAALWPTSGVVKIANPGAESWAFQVQPSNGLSRDTAAGIRAVTVRELMQHAGVDKIDLLKMDIEGGEGPLFEADSEVWLPHVERIIIETHGQRNDDLVRGVLRRAGFADRLQGEKRIWERM